MTPKDSDIASSRDALSPADPLHPRAGWWELAACWIAGVIVPAAVSSLSRGNSSTWLWTWNPIPTSHVYAALGLSLVLVATLVAVGRLSDRWSASDHAAVPWVRRLGLLGVVVGVACLCLIWRVTESPLDSVLWRRLAHDPFIFGSEALGRWSHYLGYQLVAFTDLSNRVGFEEGPRVLALVLASVFAGAFYLGCALALGPRAFPTSRRSHIVLFLFVTPTAVVYAGLMEVTPWGYALTGVYLLAGLRYIALDLRRPPWIEAVILMFAVWAHGSVLFGTGAHAFLCLRWFVSSAGGARTGVAPARIAKLAAVGLFPFAGIVVTLWVAYEFGTGHASSKWYGNALGGADRLLTVAWSESTKRAAWHVVFGSREQLIGLANLVLFGCPLLLVVPLAVARTMRRHRSETIFLLASCMGLLLLALGFTPARTGGYRMDFDVLAGFATPALLLVALWWDTCMSRGQREALQLGCAAAAFSFLLTLRLDFP